MTGRTVAVIGPMGAGKSSVGRKLAKRLGVPFADTDQLIAGFWIVSAPSREAVVERFRQAPFDRGELEIRQVFELEDFGDLLSPEAKAFEAGRRA